ncbi:hypothetical protein CYMTET_31432 [Cymbomonas tetramitiformis]|uniref:Uncharacterized protein n=1 Tax=Cymbomonas tetramitiformis TaxID=36881 RepID=A0AAE0KSV9_9CHLO|nr:hypothetical protein CYMTET_31432 [Cymbomonas tetramitiformis]
MAVFGERLDEVGKVVLTWDPSSVAPRKSTFTTTLPWTRSIRRALRCLARLRWYGDDADVPDGSDAILAEEKLQWAECLLWTSGGSSRAPLGTTQGRLRVLGLP